MNQKSKTSIGRILVMVSISGILMLWMVLRAADRYAAQKRAISQSLGATAVAQTPSITAPVVHGWDGNPDHPDCSENGHVDPNDPHAVISAKYSDECDGDVPIIHAPTAEDKELSEAADCCREARDGRSIPLSHAIAFAKSHNDKVREWLAYNRSTPAAALRQLKDDSDYHVLHALALNDHSPVDVLTYLAQSDNWMIRSSVADNASSPLWLLGKLVHDPDQEVRTVARSAIGERMLGRENVRE